MSIGQGKSIERRKRFSYPVDLRDRMVDYKACGYKAGFLRRSGSLNRVDVA
ncbi:MAG: hypothetical protein NZ899_01950 [Thermoguttaceae bacterium]|nr:hypothetical protein [Thermoguttaceae bacterium]